MYSRSKHNSSLGITPSLEVSAPRSVRVALRYLAIALSSRLSKREKKREREDNVHSSRGTHTHTHIHIQRRIISAAVYDIRYYRVCRDAENIVGAQMRYYTRARNKMRARSADRRTLRRSYSFRGNRRPGLVEGASYPPYRRGPPSFRSAIREVEPPIHPTSSHPLLFSCHRRNRFSLRLRGTATRSWRNS